ncbi:MAG: BREX-1 system adenine-specific DNA-methyltransferase PglX, partial [Flavobacterium sp.]
MFTNLKPYLNVLQVLTAKYEAIAANPPYMGQKNMNGILKTYANKHYPRSKGDLFAVFMDVCYGLLKKLGRYGMINPQSWMFLSSYEELREDLLAHQILESMLHLGPRTFDELGGEVVQNTSFIIQKRFVKEAKGTYYRLVSYRSTEEKRQAFSHTSDIFSEKYQQDFSYITGSPISYWVTKNVQNIFLKNKSLGEIETIKQGMATSDNGRFLKEWHEVDYNKIGLGLNDREVAKRSKKKWFPYNKGGGYKKWYGNQQTVVNWENDGFEIREYTSRLPQGSDVRLKSKEYYFKESVTWSSISTNSFAVRYSPKGFIFDVGGSSLFPGEKYISFYVSLLCSNLANFFLGTLNPTLNFQIKDVKALPIIIDDNKAINSHSLENIRISKLDWDSRETSWEFSRSPLLNGCDNFEGSFFQWVSQLQKSFFQLHQNEVELNQIFINIYGLQDELQPDVALEDITILQDELDYNALSQLQQPYSKQLLPIKGDVVIQQFISYAIGCFMGRFRLDKSGLQVAHPNPTLEELEAYTYTSPVTSESYRIEIDEDGIVPLMGSKGNFADDAYNRLRQFLVAVWGENTLTQNINFMQDCLNQDLEEYLVKRFWSYHVRTYNKKPIYWLFSSKKGAFQALVYMHRMSRFAAEKLRDKYLLKHIQFMEQEIARMEGNMTSLSKSDQKRLDQLRKDLQECNDYDLLLKDIATKQIEFD